MCGTSFPRAIVHIDADAFFASVEQARNPDLRGKPVVTGKERGIASSLSYEAKAKGVKRAMQLSEIKKLCPDVVILPSDYETYSLLSKRLFEIVRRFTPDVEEYSIDECFADITGLRRHYHTSYENIAKKIQETLEAELGCTFSIGLAPTKVLAKIGSKWNKPSGLTVIKMRDIANYLKDLPTQEVWGIGPMTSALLGKYRVYTALQFASADKEWVQNTLTKPHQEIWEELNGKTIYNIEMEEKESYASIQKTKTFTPPSTDRDFVFAQLVKNIENACMKARRYKQAAHRVSIFLKTQDFRYRGVELKLSRKTAFPDELLGVIHEAFDKLFVSGTLYRSTGVTLFKLEELDIVQPDLFGAAIKAESKMRLYESVDHIRTRYGKHTLFLGASFLAHKNHQHRGDRKEDSIRERTRLPFETGRKRLGIPIFLDQVRS